MKIAIIHCHLNRGGVTQIIVNQLRGLNMQMTHAARLPIALLYGGRRQGWPDNLASELQRLDITWYEIPELDYDNVRRKSATLVSQLQSALQQAAFHPEETVLHVHNHALGKNVAIPPAVASLAQQGYGLLLHIHDFAEDFRPDNYRQLASAIGNDRFDALPEVLYPQAPQIHYAVLNARDHAVMLEAGVPDSRLHLLPNAVAEVGRLPPRDEARAKLAGRFAIPADHRFVLYPVRGIRRKNLGEVLLWSTLAGGKVSFGLTLPPMNPLEQPSYERWKALAGKIGLPCAFELGSAAGLSYGENLAAADLILTTSVAEGFGLVFLEAWLSGRPLIGRDLPGVTSDFVAAGIRFPALQPHLLVPVAWLGEAEFRRDIAGSYQHMLACFGRRLPPSGSLDHQVDVLIQDELVDFGCCTTRGQQSVIERVAANPTDRARLLEANPWISAALATGNADFPLIEENAEIVRTKYSLAKCVGRLEEIYQCVRTSDRTSTLQRLENGERILEYFLDLSRFHPLRVES